MSSSACGCTSYSSEETVSVVEDAIAAGLTFLVALAVVTGVLVFAVAVVTVAVD